MAGRPPRFLPLQCLKAAPSLRADAQHGAAAAFVVRLPAGPLPLQAASVTALFDIFKSGLKQMMGPQEESPSGCLVWFGNI